MAHNTVNGVKVPFLPVGGVEKLKQREKPPLPVDRTFGSILQRELENVTFSKHAQERLRERNISLSDDDLSKLQSAVNKAETKGARESLILLRDIAFIVSIANRTVVTAINGESVNENVFTNIDSAVIVESRNHE